MTNLTINDIKKYLKVLKYYNVFLYVVFCEQKVKLNLLNLNSNI